MIQILGVILTVIAASGLLIIWEWMLFFSAWARARLRAWASPHAKDGTDEDTDSKEDNNDV